MADRDPPDEQYDVPTNTAVTVVDGPRRASATMPAVLAGIERFTIIKTLGQGGMGTVYAAYDALLDRKVAVKVVRTDRPSRFATVSPRDQLLREAQAMARLAHPNVVTVYEVGELAEDIYIVLEFVDGTTLDRWLAERRRTWREIIAAFTQAGRGLAAAHEAGIVNRDVKPQNILRPPRRSHPGHRLRRRSHEPEPSIRVVALVSVLGGLPPQLGSASYLTRATRFGTPPLLGPLKNIRPASSTRAAELFLVSHALRGQPSQRSPPLPRSRKKTSPPRSVAGNTYVSSVFKQAVDPSLKPCLSSAASIS